MTRRDQLREILLAHATDMRSDNTLAWQQARTDKALDAITAICAGGSWPAIKAAFEEEAAR